MFSDSLNGVEQRTLYDLAPSHKPAGSGLEKLSHGQKSDGPAPSVRLDPSLLISAAVRAVAGPVGPVPTPVGAGGETGKRIGGRMTTVNGACSAGEAMLSPPA